MIHGFGEGKFRSAEQTLGARQIKAPPEGFPQMTFWITLLRRPVLWSGRLSTTLSEWTVIDDWPERIPV